MDSSISQRDIRTVTCSVLREQSSCRTDALNSLKSSFLLFHVHASRSYRGIFGGISCVIPRSCDGDESPTLVVQFKTDRPDTVQYNRNTNLYKSPIAQISLQGKHFLVKCNPTHSLPMHRPQSCHRVSCFALACQALRIARTGKCSHTALANDPFNTHLAIVLVLHVFHRSRQEHTRAATGSSEHPAAYTLRQSPKDRDVKHVPVKVQ